METSNNFNNYIWPFAAARLRAIYGNGFGRTEMKDMIKSIDDIFMAHGCFCTLRRDWGQVILHPTHNIIVNHRSEVASFKEFTCIKMIELNVTQKWKQKKEISSAWWTEAATVTDFL